MQSTLTSRETDPHDIFAIEPDVVLAARADKSPSDLVHDILSRSSSPQAHMQSHMASTASAGASPPPQVDTTFRPTNVNSILGERPSSGKWAKRSFMALFALCSAVAAAGWQHYGDEAKQMIASWTPSFTLSSLLHTETPAVAEQPGSPAVQVSSQASSQTATADQAAAQPVPRNRYLRRNRRRPLHRLPLPRNAANCCSRWRAISQRWVSRSSSSKPISSRSRPARSKSPAARPEPPKACRDQAV